MNQQRSRRFRSAKDAELLEQRATSRGELIQHQRFDSNCITPGTEFMSRLHEALKQFIKSKISTNELWQKCRIILSGHNSPGEGEHKIMDYIRYLKSKVDYNPNTRHCLYGLDADLIILGLCTHELHFVVLREEVKFGRKAKGTSVEATRFFLLHLGLLREYLELEFNELRQLDASFDIAKLIDDWVLIGFLVGNDFIPHLPSLHISSNALPLLYKTYIKVYPTLGGNINENGKLNLERLEKYFAALSDVEFTLFQESFVDLKYFGAKQSKNSMDETFNFDAAQINNENTDTDMVALIENSNLFLEGNEMLDEPQHIVDEFEAYKKNYYVTKLNQIDKPSDLKENQAVCYITALQWILDYYYRGTQSWDWYYPHHYAPFISDLKNFKNLKIKFNLGKPFLPFEQLLAVLPAASKDLLPNAYRHLMTSATSEISCFYPNDFETDLNGKKHEWEAVVLIPFIDEKLLLKAIQQCEGQLRRSEKERNQHGPMLQYEYIPKPEGIETDDHVFYAEKKIWSEEIAISSDTSVCVELPNKALNIFFPGFPTMKYLKYDFELRCGRVKVFEHPSRNDNLILMPRNRPGFDNVFNVAEKYLNQIVFTGWPHLIKAKVVGVFNKDKNLDAEGIHDMEPKAFQLHVKFAQEHLINRMGIEFNDFSVMVQVRTFIGFSYVCGSQGKISTTDVWSNLTTVYPAQGIVAEIEVHNTLCNEIKKIDQLFPINSIVFFMGNPYFGSEGTVLNPLLMFECGRLKVNITVLPEPDFSEAKNLQSQLEKDYLNSYQAAAVIGISVKCLGRLTGSVLVISGARRANLVDNTPKTNVGLQFKYPKQQEERAGYARRINNQWFYSSKAIALIQKYHRNFPMVIAYLSSHSTERNEFCFEADLFRENVGESCVEEIVTWLKAQDHMKADRIACGSKTVEKEAIEKVIDSVEQLKMLPVKTVKLQVKPHLLLKPDITLSTTYKSKKPIRLFDRAVIVKTTYMVPLGSKGTIIGIYPTSDPNPVRLECVNSVENFLEVLFDKRLPYANDIYGIAKDRVYKVPESSVLVIFTQDGKQFEMQAVRLNHFEDGSVKNSSQLDFDNNIQFNNMQQQTNATSTQTSITNNFQHFWMPNDVAKVKHSNITDFLSTETSNPSNRYFKSSILDNMNIAKNSEHTLLQKQELNECPAKTQALKSLLGLSGRINQNVESTEIERMQSKCPTQLHNLKLSDDFFDLDSNLLSQKGMFIPLQANQGCQHITKQSSSSCTSVVHKNISSIRISEPSSSTENSVSQGSLSKKKIVRSVNNKPILSYKKLSREPRIGAKFDNTF